MVNHKRVCRLYREQGLQLRNKTPKRRVKAKLRSDRANAKAANDIWAMDFVHDQLFDGTKIRALTIVDVLSRVSPAIGVRQSYREANVVETLERGAAECGYPTTIRVDNGSEFVSKELDLWAYLKGVTLDFSRPGKPTDNAFIESFNGKFRTECLNADWFLSLDEARAKCEAWRRDYNECVHTARSATRRRWSFIGWRNHRPAVSTRKHDFSSPGGPRLLASSNDPTTLARIGSVFRVRSTIKSSAALAYT
jgi:putative transposase